MLSSHSLFMIGFWQINCIVYLSVCTHKKTFSDLLELSKTMKASPVIPSSNPIYGTLAH